MSGAEADISSDGETSFEDEDVPLPLSPLKEGTDEPFEVVLKGGKPWGFTLARGIESKASIQISEINADGKAEEAGCLKRGDYILQVNGVRCHSLDEAEDLVQSAFRTLTLQVWRGTGEPLSSPVRSASFLQKARELSERARQQAAVQDDSALFAESKSATSLRMKPRQRRIESFHGGRRGSSQSSSSSASAIPVTSQHTPVTSTYTPLTTTTDAGAKPGLKGWATEHDLSWSRQPVIMSGTHATGVPSSSRHMPLTPAKSSPSLNQEGSDKVKIATTPRGYTPKSPPPLLAMTKSTPDIPDQVNYENITSPTSPKSPSWYQQKFPNRSVFDFSSAPPVRRSAGSPRNSFASGSPRNSYTGGSPRNSYVSGSPRNSYASPSYSQQSYPQTTLTGFSPMSVSSSSVLSHSPGMETAGSLRSGGSFAQNQKLTGANINSYDDTPTHSQQKNYDRRSLPPQMLHQYRQDFQKENNKTEQTKQLTSMPVTREEDEIDKEIPDMKPRPPNDLDLRPMYSPPAPPVRDISSLKYVKYSQNHEKYPSWPVTTANPPQNTGPPVDSQTGDKRTEKDSDNDKSGSGETQVPNSSERNRKSPNGDRKGSDENKQTRNQSDPGFKQKNRKPFYTQRKPTPKESNYENLKSDEERFDEFYRQSKPGYPPPKLDPDGHNYGDEKYSIPSPPERDMPNLDQKSLVEKIAAVISPNSSHQSSYQYNHHYPAAADNNTPRSHKADMATSPLQPPQNSSKIPGIYFQQAMNSQNLIRPPSMSQNKNMVDSGTNPLGSPNEEKGKFCSRTLIGNPRNNSFMSPTDSSRGLIIRQMPYYNTSTQTDETLGNQSKTDSSSETGNPPGQGQISHSGSETLASNVRSDSSQSSGIGSMTFSDHHSAPLLRKLSEEFYRGKLSGNVPNEKRSSSSSTYEELKSPQSESHYGGSGLKEAESYSSVVIHPQEHSGPFGSDDFGSSPSLVTSKPEMSDFEQEHAGDRGQLHKARYSMDSAMLLHKTSGSMSMPPRGLQEARFTSESNLSSGNSYPQQRNLSGYSQSLLHLNRPASSLGEATQHRSYGNSSSSSSTRPGGSMEARSSGSRLSSDSSTGGITKINSRRDSDNVFYDKSSPSPSDLNKPSNTSDNHVPSVGVGRKESMKLAFGTYDENEHHYATPYGHQRNNSEVLSPTARDPNTAHGRSMSFTDYMPMHYNQNAVDPNRLDQIKEEGSEVRWQEAVRKSKSLSRETVPSNYENIQIGQGEVKITLKGSGADKSGTEMKKETKMRRTVSEQIRPHNKEKKPQRRVDATNEMNKDYSSSGESSKGNKSDGETIPKSMTHHMSDSELKRMQQKAVLDFVERKKKGSDSSEPQSPKRDHLAPEFPSPTTERKSPTPSSPSAPPHSPLGDITKRYNYTKAQRNESLRRTRSISSNSSRDSTADYVDMKRLDRNYQTEWSRLRSQDGVVPRRPLSIGSDISAMDNYVMATSSPVATPDIEIAHGRSLSETTPKQIDDRQLSKEQPFMADGSSLNSNETMVTSPIYNNIGGDYPKRPPPPIPGSNEEQPPALPPRSYHRFASSKSESFLLSHLDAQQVEDLKEPLKRDSSGLAKWENGTLKEDAYAQQLRRQARKFSEHQHKPISMQVVSTKSTVQVSLTQSYKQEPTQVLEAVPVQKLTTTTTSLSSPKLTDKKTVLHHSPPTVIRDIASPAPPPLPTPMKNGEVEIAVDLNSTADFPPPPPEFVGNTEHSDEQADRCADDSYGSYKSRNAPREVGKYKRAVSDSKVLHLHHEAKYRPFHELNSKDVSETPNKPPRKKLEMQGRDSPTQSQRSNSPAMPGTDNKSTNQMPAPQVPLFQAAEVSHVQHVQKSMAKPLQSVSVLKPSMQTASSPSSSGSFVKTSISPGSIDNASNSSGSFISTVVQRPSSISEDPRPSVKDRVKNIEVFSHSPTSSKGSSQQDSPGTNVNSAFPSDTSAEAGTPTRVSDSLERLESSVKSSDSFRDRLRPVVKKVEPEHTGTDQQKDYMHSPHERLTGDVVDKYVVTPPQIPSRTYRQMEKPQQGDRSQPGDRPPRPSSKPGESPHRRNSFQNRSAAGVNHPRSYENKTGANIHSPMGQNILSYSSKSGSTGPEPQRSPAQSTPESQVLSRPQTQRQLRGRLPSSDKPHQQNENLPSPEVRLSASHRNNEENVRTRENTQNQSVHSGLKHTYDPAFSPVQKSRHSSSSQLDNRDISVSPKNMSVSPKTSPISSKNQQNEKNLNSSYNQQKPPHNCHSEENREGQSRRPELRGDYSKDRQYQSHEQRVPVQTTSYRRGDFKNWKNENTENKMPVSQEEAKSNNIKNTADGVNSQTKYSKDNTETDKHPNPLVTINHARQPSAEELECDAQAKELATVLQDSDKELCNVLKSDSNKIRMQYMDGLFPVASDSTEQKRPRSASKKEDRKEEKEEEETKEPTSPMPSNYYVSPPKAMIELEIRKFGDTSQLTKDIGDNDTLAQKKEELLQRMVKKVEILKDDKTELLTDIDDNEHLGRQVLSIVEMKCRSQQEKDKYRSYIDDMDKIIRLLLKLSGLLARAENTIQGLNENTNEKIKKMTFDKRDRLHRQHEDAKELKVDIDRRSEQVETFLRESMSASELDDYHYYIKMKSKYTIQMQELEDKITLGSEQIGALQKSIPTVKTKS